MATTFPGARRTIDPDRTATIMLVWQGVLAVGALATLAYLWLGAPTIPPLVRVLASVALGATVLAAAGSLPLIARRQTRGRTITLVVNYLLFVAVLLITLHRLGIFTGIDGLAAVFGRGVPFLLVVFAGYLIGAVGDRFEGTAAERRWRQAGRAIALVGLALFLLRVNIFVGLLSVLRRLNNPLDLGLLVLVLLLVGVLWLAWRRATADAFHASNANREALDGWLFLSPNLLGFLIFFAGPLVFSLYVSFTNWDAFGTQDWVGWANYANIFDLRFARLPSADALAASVIDPTQYDEVTRLTLFGQSFVIGAADKLFWLALGNTLRFAAMAIPLATIPALLLAVLLNSKIPGMTFFRAVYFLPSVAAVVGIALVWQLLFNATVGYINYTITGLINMLNNLGSSFVDPQIRWLSSSNTALLSVVIMSAWQLIGYNTVLFLAGLQNIPGELYEAATVDGAGSWSKFWRITLPLLGPTTFFVLTTTVIRVMQVFDEVFILIPSNPAGPGNSTLTMTIYLYQKGFQRFEQGYASAIAWVLFALIFVVTLVQFRQRRAEG